jgi:hypothetical protein
MKNTIEALDQFTRALGPVLLPALAPAAPRDPEPARAVTPAAPVRPAATPRQLAAMSRDGITRRTPRGDWVRRAQLAVLALTMALGFSRAVRAAGRAVDSYWRQAVAQSLTTQQHGHPTPSVRHTPILSRSPGLSRS